MDEIEKLRRSVNSRARTDAASLGKRIRWARKRAGWSQADLALQMGLKPQSCAQWELGQFSASLERLHELAKLLQVDVIWLTMGLQMTGIDENATEMRFKAASEAAGEGRWWK